MDKKVIHNPHTSFAQIYDKELKLAHIPVLVDEVLELLDLKEGDMVFDGTIGTGGHAQKILEIIGDKGLLIGTDKDKDNLEFTRKRLKHYQKNLYLCHGGYEDMNQVLKRLKIKKVDAILLDLGLSSPHVDQKERGFTFREDTLLDMRFDRSNPNLMTASGILNSYSLPKLADIFLDYGEMRASYRLAKAIVELRKKKRLATSFELLSMIQKVYNSPLKLNSIAAKIFQALRIEVNQELEALKTGLEKATKLLRLNRRIAVISYHSLEDRIIKRFFRETKMLYRITKKPITPSELELKLNPRSRSAKLRVAELVSLN